MPTTKPGRSKLRQQDLFGCPRVGRAFEANKLTWAQTARNFISDAANVRNIGILVDRERRRHADNNDIAGIERRKICRCCQLLVSNHSCQIIICNVSDVVGSLIDLRNANGISIVPDNPVADLRFLHRERQPDVPYADDSNDGRVSRNLFAQRHLVAKIAGF